MLRTKQIILSKGKKALVDEDDFDRLNNFKWCVFAKKYAGRYDYSDGKKKCILMHRVVMNAPSNVEIDHKNGNPLDNRKSNLRPCTSSQNKCNKFCQSNNKSGYKGVSLHKQTRKFVAWIKFSGTRQYLGIYAKKIDAARAYNDRAKLLHGEFAFLNPV